MSCGRWTPNSSKYSPEKYTKTRESEYIFGTRKTSPTSIDGEKVVVVLLEDG